MSQTTVSLRTSTGKQDLNNQKLEALEWARKKGMKIAEFVAHHHLFAQDQRESSHHY